ncbi:MAG: hydantoinase B/oxoprolinase family protein, partial [Leptospiraceae bacterium]|nr:hydantoinase B/oxoprolinase family protein [Leptospiraceae bacterium]
MAEGWKLFADRGGTFTDIVALDPEGNVHFHKLLSRTDDYDDPVSAGMQHLFQRVEAKGFPGRVQDLRVGTTIGTNALLEHKVARVGLLVTSGFGDLLRIGYQARPSLFSLRIDLPPMLYHAVATVQERMDSQGKIIQSLDPDSLNRALDSLLQAEVQCLAVLFLHSNCNPIHELQARAIIQKRCHLPVYLSHQSSPMPGAVARGDTTLVDAALGPMIQDYSQRLQVAIGGDLHFMGSAGALIPASAFSGKDSLLSGPAGGLRAVAQLCKKLGIERAVGFDMGGTSTDVFTFDGELQRLESTEIGGFRIQAPHLRIHTIASGGGSILRRDGRRLLVGPESAGAYPGPAFYKRNGPATVTDANAVLGRVLASHFPSVFGPNGNDAPDLADARAALLDLQADRGDAVRTANAAELAGQKNESSIGPLEQLAQGFISIACEQMAGAVRKMTIEQGRDPANYTMVSFGGAGGQVACEVAERAGLAKVVFPGLAGLFSAVGIAASEPARMQTIALEGDLKLRYSELQRLCLGETDDSASQRLEFRLLPSGSDFPVLLGYSGLPALSVLEDDFHSRFQETYGYSYTGPIQIRSVLIETKMGQASEIPAITSKVAHVERPLSHRVFDGQWSHVPLFSREDLPGGFEIQGPALITSKTDTVYLRESWMAKVLDSGDLLAQRSNSHAAKDTRSETATEADLLEERSTGTEEIIPPEAATSDKCDQPEFVMTEKSDQSGATMADESAQAGALKTREPGQPESVRPDASAQREAPAKEVLSIAAEIHQRRLESIATEMGTVLQKTAQSVNIKERLDFSCAIFDASGRILVSAPHIPVHLGSMQDSVQAILPMVSSRMHVLSQGFFVLNDPYQGGTHLPDIT